jgi:hypothetical protein
LREILCFDVMAVTLTRFTICHDPDRWSCRALE